MLPDQDSEVAEKKQRVLETIYRIKVTKKKLKELEILLDKHLEELYN